MGKQVQPMARGVQGMKEWPLEERPRERLLREGAESLSDAQLLAIVLRIGSREGSVMDLARHLLKTFGGLQQMGMIEIAEFISVHGIGPVKAAQIKALFELSRRIHSSPPQRRRQILSSAELFRIYAPYFKYKRKEIFKSVLLDGKHRILRDVIVSEGSLTLSVVHPREAFNPAIRESAAAIIFLHNHPSGDPTPSPEDIETTRRLVEVGELVGIRVLDHIIIGDGRYVSFSDQGLLTKGKLC